MKVFSATLVSMRFGNDSKVVCAPRVPNNRLKTCACERTNQALEMAHRGEACFQFLRVGRDNLDSCEKTSTGKGQVLAAGETLDWNSVGWKKAR